MRCTQCLLIGQHAFAEQTDSFAHPRIKLALQHVFDLCFFFFPYLP